MRTKPLLIALFLTLIVAVLPRPLHAQVQDWEVRDPTTGEVIADKSCTVDGVPTLECLEVVYGNVLYLSSAVMLLILFLMIVYGAFTYLTSMGNSTRVEKGKKILTWAFIGLGVYLLSYLILFIIDVAFMGGRGDMFRLNIPGPLDPQ